MLDDHAGENKIRNLPIHYSIDSTAYVNAKRTKDNFHRNLHRFFRQKVSCNNDNNNNHYCSKSNTNNNRSTNNNNNDDDIENSIHYCL